MEFDKVLDKRVSSRKFKDEALKRDEIEKLLLAAKKAPIAKGDYKSVNLTVITNKEVISLMSEEFNQVSSKEDDSLYGARTFILVSSNKDDTSRYEDAGCILENISLKATDLSIGSVYIRGLVNTLADKGKYVEKINLPQGFKPVSGIVLGYVDGELVGKDHQMKVNFID